VSLAVMFVLRQARPRDKRRLLELARLLDSVNMPTTAREMSEAVDRSCRSFRGRVRDRSRALYMFCAENLETGRLAGASMIIAKHGTPASPHYYLDVDRDERYSHTLRKMFRHTFLRLRHSMDGPTEVGGLIVDPEMRRLPEKVGKQLSWVRFLYIAQHRSRFENRIIAEIMPPMTADRSNLFWDHYGRRMTGLSFREADRLSTRDKEFIRALFPDAPLYTPMLPDEVRSSLGAVGEQSRGAVRLLEQAGLRFIDQIDPFDAGPYYGAAIADLEPIKALRAYRVVPGTVHSATGTTEHSYLVSCEERAAGFRAVQAKIAAPQGGRIVLPSEAMAALDIKEGSTVEVIPLPE
jgi:arginine N-succinyltransferase